MANYYSVPVEQVIQEFNTDPINGLSNTEAENRLKQFGPNVIPEKPQDLLVLVFLRQFKTPFIYMLLIAASIIFFLQSPLDAAVISVILIFNAVIATVQESRARNVLAKLKEYIKTNALALRNNESIIINAELLVPGDIIILLPGEKVPADGRLIEENNLAIDESMLTGESTPVQKTSATLHDQIPLADQKNMVFKGTYVLAGFGKAIVTNTGIATELGTIGQTTQSIQTAMPLKKELDNIARLIIIIASISIVLLFAVGTLQGRTFVDLLIVLTALFICVVPECLPGVFTIILVTGAYKMAKKNVVVKYLQAAEGVGHIDTLLIDKTGTLTLNQLMVNKLIFDNQIVEITGHGYETEGILRIDKKQINPADYQQLLEMSAAIILMNKADIEYKTEKKTYAIKGNPTEAALFIFAKKIGITEKLLGQYKLIAELPFSEKGRYKAGICKISDTSIKAFIIGAPEIIFRRTKLSDNAQQALQSLLDEGLRLIGFGSIELSSNQIRETKNYDKIEELTESLIEQGLQNPAIFAMQDSIRPNVSIIIQQIDNRNIRVIMATGDHKSTALFVAKKTNILNASDICLDSSEFNKLTEQELLKILPTISVFSRVSPQEKLIIINILKKQGHIIAMTGDGVNDAPSLVAADIGIAMGIIGTDVAKEAADLILLDDSLESIVYAIDISRSMVSALRRVILYFFTTNLGELLIIFFSILLNLKQLPFLPVQILWLNLVTDGFLDIALAMEPDHEEKKNTTSQRLLDLTMLLKMFYMAAPMAIGSMAIFFLYRDDITVARTAVLICMAMFQWMNAWNCRSESKSNFQIGFFSNTWLVITTVFVLLLQFGLLYIYPLQVIFKTVPLSLGQWIIIIAISSSLFFIEETRKLVMQKYFYT